MGFIYKITNSINEKIYVGKTVHSNIQKRFQEHVHDAPKKRFEKRPLYRAMNKYGADKFKIEQIEECSNDIINEREIYWIEKLGSYHDGYNATFGGDGKLYIDRAKVTELWKSGLNAKEVANITGHDRGYISEIISCSISNYKEELQKRINAINIKNSLKIVQLNKDNLSYIDEFCGSECTSKKFSPTSSSSHHISDVCKGKRKTAYGFKWMYLEDYQKLHPEYVSKFKK